MTLFLSRWRQCNSDIFLCPSYYGSDEPALPSYVIGPAGPCCSPHPFRAEVNFSSFHGQEETSTSLSENSIESLSYIPRPRARIIFCCISFFPLIMTSSEPKLLKMTRYHFEYQIPIQGQVIEVILTEAEGRREAYHGFSNASPNLAVTTHV